MSVNRRRKTKPLNIPECIHAKDLRNACAEERDAFGKKFPNGMPLTKANVRYCIKRWGSYQVLHHLTFLMNFTRKERERIFGLTTHGLVTIVTKSIRAATVRTRRDPRFSSIEPEYTTNSNNVWLGDDRPWLLQMGKVAPVLEKDIIDMLLESMNIQ